MGLSEVYRFSDPFIQNFPNHGLFLAVNVQNICDTVFCLKDLNFIGSACKSHEDNLCNVGEPLYYVTTENCINSSRISCPVKLITVFTDLFHVFLLIQITVINFMFY